MYAGAALQVESPGPKSLKTSDPVGLVPPATVAVSKVGSDSPISGADTDVVTVADDEAGGPAMKTPSGDSKVVFEPLRLAIGEAAPSASAANTGTWAAP